MVTVRRTKLDVINAGVSDETPLLSPFCSIDGLSFGTTGLAVDSAPCTKGSGLVLGFSLTLVGVGAGGKVAISTFSVLLVVVSLTVATVVAAAAALFKGGAALAF